MSNKNLYTGFDISRSLITFSNAEPSLDYTSLTIHPYDTISVWQTTYRAKRFITLSTSLSFGICTSIFGSESCIGVSILFCEVTVLTFNGTAAFTAYMYQTGWFSVVFVYRISISKVKWNITARPIFTGLPHPTEMAYPSSYRIISWNWAKYIQKT